MSEWNSVRYELDNDENFSDVHGSPWYSDAEYDTFSAAEYNRRHDRARSLMSRDGLDALILTGSPNIYSLGGAVTWGCGLIDDRGMCQYLILPREGEPTLIYPHPGSHIEAARKMVSVSDVRGSQHGHFGRAMADRLTELALGRGRIGITAADRTGPEYMGVAAYQELRRCLPQVDLVFCPNLFHELTYRKSAEEIQAMRRAGEFAIASLEAVKKACSAGALEYELAASGTGAVLARGGRVHLMMIGSTAMDDPRLVYPNPNPSRRALRDGDVVLTEIAAAYLGYSAKIGHPVTLGPPSPGVNTLHDVAVEVLKGIEVLLRPGTDLEDVVVAASAFRSAGVQCRPMVLHGIDLITAGPKVSVGGVSAAQFDRRLAPGMVVNIEAAPIDAGGTYGLFLSRTYAIDDDGVECLTPYPVEELLVAG